MDPLDGLPLALANGAGVAGLLVGLFIMLATGRLATYREVRDRNDAIKFLERALSERDKQLSLLLRESVPTIGFASTGSTSFAMVRVTC